MADFADVVGSGQAIILAAVAPDGTIQLGQTDLLSNLLTSLATKIAGEDLAADRMLVEYGCQPTNITGVNSAQQVSANPGYLHGILIGKPVDTKTITVKDGAGGTVIATITCAGAAPVFIPLNCRFAAGLEITPNDVGINLTAIWR